MMSEQLAREELVIVQQPSVISPPGYVAIPSTGIVGQVDCICPPGLEHLVPLDRIFIHQKVELTFLRRPNKYTAVDENQQIIYHLNEEAEGLFGRLCAGGNERAFKISCVDAAGREAIRIERQLEIFKSEIFVYSGNIWFGSVKRLVCSCAPDFRVYDEHGHQIFRIASGVCIGGCEPEFMICTNNGEEIGLIKKHWAGFKREFFTDIFGVNFPVDISVQYKALLLAAAILIDFSYFEQH